MNPRKIFPFRHISFLFTESKLYYFYKLIFGNYRKCSISIKKCSIKELIIKRLLKHSNSHKRILVKLRNQAAEKTENGTIFDEISSFLETYRKNSISIKEVFLFTKKTYYKRIIGTLKFAQRDFIFS